MARFSGVVGYGNNIEDPSGSGIWVDRITEQNCYGDIIRNTASAERFSRGDPSASFKVNEDIGISNSISIVADRYAIDNWFKIKYVKWEGFAWEVNSVEIRAPRLILELGRKYNGPTPILVSPDIPIFNSEIGELTIVDQKGIIFKNIDTNEFIDEEGSPYIVETGEFITVLATPALGYYFSSDEINEWVFEAD